MRTQNKIQTYENKHCRGRFAGSGSMSEDVIDKSGALRGFPAYFPLPYRVSIIVALGVFLFGTNITLLLRAGIDVESLFYPSAVSSSNTRRHQSLARPIYGIAINLIMLSTIALTGFWLLTVGTTTINLEHRWIPLLLFLAFFAILLSPVKFYAHERYRFMTVLKRIMLGGIDPTDRFLDIIVADVLTSYAKVFGDIVTTLCLLVSSPTVSYAAAKNNCSRSVLVPVAIASPYAIRLSQCLIEYRRTGKLAHLANALKYCTAFPVILISTIQLGRTGGEVGTPNTGYVSDGRLYQVWVLACLINSGYSFWWDVTKDWDLTLLLPASSINRPASPSALNLRTVEVRHYGLRNNLTFSPRSYYMAIAIDLVLRMLWSLKLSPHLHGLVEYESGVFVMECLEVLRRWMWIFLRVECEHHRANSSEGVIALTDLGGVAFTNGASGKIDQD